MTPTQILRERIEKLWTYAPQPGHRVWKAGIRSQTKRSRRRNAWELMCGALWHLELAVSLGVVPSTTIEQSRSQQIQKYGGIPWEQLLKCRQKPSAVVIGDTLRISCGLPSSASPCLVYLLQSMLVADAAIRLDGARDILLRTWRRKHRPLVLCDRKTIESDAHWLGNDASRFSALPWHRRHIITIVAFRDWYLHGEKPGQTKVLSGCSPTVRAQSKSAQHCRRVSHSLERVGARLHVERTATVRVAVTLPLPLQRVDLFAEGVHPSLGGHNTSA